MKKSHSIERPVYQRFPEAIKELSERRGVKLALPAASQWIASACFHSAVTQFESRLVLVSVGRSKAWNRASPDGWLGASGDAGWRNNGEVVDIDCL